MKSKIKKFWGLGLIVTLLASLAVATVPVSAADPLAWNGEAIPSVGGKLLGPAGVDVCDIAVSSDGATIYAAPGSTANKTLYKSTNGGATWSAINVGVGAATMDADLVAVAPDDSNLIAVANRNTDDDPVAACTIYISTNGGASWGTLGIPTGPATAINDIDISASGSGSNHLFVAGIDSTAANPAGVWYYGLGVGGSWVVADTLAGGPSSGATGAANCTSALAIQASPNFASDLVMTCASTNGTHTFFNMFSRNSGAQGAWNASAWPGTMYPVTLATTGAAAVPATDASISLAPTYLGGDEVERRLRGHRDRRRRQPRRLPPEGLQRHADHRGGRYIQRRL
jgi:hypothetical protein